jgi:hypothetical protein
VCCAWRRSRTRRFCTSCFPWLALCGTNGPRRYPHTLPDILKPHGQWRVSDDDYLEDLKAELIHGQRLAVDEDGGVLVWSGDTAPSPVPAGSPPSAGARVPLTYTPAYLAEKILTSRRALEGERKQVTVLFADLKGSVVEILLTCIE